jgi:hypothetical protein
MINEAFHSVPGYERAPDSLRPRTRLALHHRGRIWVMSCAEGSDAAGRKPPRGEVRSGELASLGLALLWRALVKPFNKREDVEDLDDYPTDVDRASRGRADVQFCQSPMIAGGVRLGLSLKLLSAGVRRSGLWARQLQFGRLSILFVVLDRDDQRRVQRRAELASRLPP